MSEIAGMEVRRPKVLERMRCNGHQERPNPEAGAKERHTLVGVSPGCQGLGGR